jgi:hypothetical protein
MHQQELAKAIQITMGHLASARLGRVVAECPGRNRMKRADIMKSLISRPLLVGLIGMSLVLFFTGVELIMIKRKGAWHR